MSYAEFCTARYAYLRLCKIADSAFELRCKIADRKNGKDARDESAFLQETEDALRFVETICRTWFDEINRFTKGVGSVRDREIWGLK